MMLILPVMTAWTLMVSDSQATEWGHWTDCAPRTADVLRKTHEHWNSLVLNPMDGAASRFLPVLDTYIRAQEEYCRCHLAWVAVARRRLEEDAVSLKPVGPAIDDSLTRVREIERRMQDRLQSLPILRQRLKVKFLMANDVWMANSRNKK